MEKEVLAGFSLLALLALRFSSRRALPPKRNNGGYINVINVIFAASMALGSLKQM